MDSYNKLIGLLEKEMQAFEDSYKSMTTTQVYNDWYIIGFYQEYYDMLTTGISGQLWLDDSIIAWLANKEQPLNFLYDKWMSCDGSFSHDWEEMLDWVNLVYSEEKDKDIPKDKIMVAILDDGYYTKHHSYPEEYSSEYAHEVYTFDTPEDFIQKWYELDEGAWYWVYSFGNLICSGAVDPCDIEVFEEYYGMTFEEPAKAEELIENVAHNVEAEAIENEQRIIEAVDKYPTLKMFCVSMLNYVDDFANKALECQKDGCFTIKEENIPTPFDDPDFDFRLLWEMLADRPEFEDVEVDGGDIIIEVSPEYQRNSLEDKIRAANALAQESNGGDQPVAKARSEKTI